MNTISRGQLPAERIITIEHFVTSVYLEWIEKYQRPSTLKGYRQVWKQHLQPHCGKTWLKETRTYMVQGWLNAIAKDGTLSRNSLKRIQSTLSGVFSLAKRLGYYDGVNPVQDTRVDGAAAEAAETYAYSLEECEALLKLLPEPAATAFAVACFTGLRIGEIEALEWQDFHGGELHVCRSIWNGHVGAPKTRKSRAGVPVIRQLTERLEMHRLRSNNHTGPIFANSLGRPLSMNNLLSHEIQPVLNRCASCGKSKGRAHVSADHQYVRDPRLPQWRGWHAARRGLGSNLYRLGVTDKTIQAILRHSNVATTANYYIKTAGGDVRDAMSKLEGMVPENRQSNIQSQVGDTFGTLKPIPNQIPEAIN
jgi:integrase